MRKSLWTIPVVLLLTALGSTAARADNAAWSAPTSGFGYYCGGCQGGNSNADLGDEFTSTVSATVTGLGIWAGNDTIGGVFISPTEDETVALYDSNGDLLASATVTGADPLVDGYYWSTDLTGSASVVAGDVYTVAVNPYSNTWAYGSVVPINNWATFITNTSGPYGGGGIPVDPTTLGPFGDNNVAYYGGNVEIGNGVSPVASPEPGTSTLMLSGLGLLGLLAAARKRNAHRFPQAI